jgi:hypothetical protein
MEKFVEAAGNKAWHTAFKTLTGLKATDKFDPLELARQTYDERMLMRAVEHLK